MGRGWYLREHEAGSYIDCILIPTCSPNHLESWVNLGEVLLILEDSQVRWGCSNVTTAIISMGIEMEDVE